MGGPVHDVPRLFLGFELMTFVKRQQPYALVRVNASTVGKVLFLRFKVINNLKQIKILKSDRIS